ncbi:MAG TPA: carbamoyltransferase HypF [Acidimicrobiales bacterium]|nr:carbamoyltransferase HypF [Acidimicrobiales bacterium]
MARRRVAVRVTGVVQGVGFRPFVARTAEELGLAGHVGNDQTGVFLEAEGDPDAVERLLAALGAPPAGARVEEVEVAEVPTRDESGFRIVASRHAEGAATAIPPDVATCRACLAELFDPSDRRYRYAFIACSRCGPRYSFATGVPYDRATTTMADFALCAACATEYEDPADRRFHAQPTCCPACGPALVARRTDGTAVGTGEEALRAAAEALAAGAVVALKGLGGYHLAVDAGDPDAVGRLRARKRRSAKPFAVLVPSLAAARSLVHLDEAGTTALAGPVAPVVIAPVRDGAGLRRIATAAAPGTGTLGVLLPSTPLQHLLVATEPLAARGDQLALVMTSGNLSGEPICTDAGEATTRLGALCDLFVDHDRRIHQSVDDSVVRQVAGRAQPVRRSRGEAPLPVPLPLRSPPALALGGELKATCCAASDRRAVLSQHIGDAENLETLEHLERTAALLLELVGVHPEVVVADGHPGYRSRGLAARWAARNGTQLVEVQHHHAHLAALLAEHALPPGSPVLGVVFDGTGYGLDGTIWGGELLLGSYDAVERVGHLDPVLLPGGDAAIAHPARTALAHLAAAGVAATEAPAVMAATDELERSVVARMMATGTGCTPTTSVGRLFDAVSSILGVCQDVTYEGQAAVELEALAASAPAGGGPPLGLRLHDHAGRLLLDPAPLLAATVGALAAGAAPAVLARGFHEALAEAVAEAATAVHERTGVKAVGLSGGVFQNALLSSLCSARLVHRGFEVLEHQVVPPNDGGLALGQVAVAAARGGG